MSCQQKAMLLRQKNNQTLTDELSTEGNFTETEEQNIEEGSLQGGKSITVEEVPSKSKDFQVEEPTEGNVTIKGQLANNTKQDSSITTSSELQDERSTTTATTIRKRRSNRNTR